MKLEKRDTAGSPTSQEPKGNKPVVVYIMVLFIVAFLLMALSFLMHQRSNSEALGELQSSVTAMQEVQANQERLIELQEDLSDARETIDALREELDDANQELENGARQAAENRTAMEKLQAKADAQSALYTLMQQYAARDYDDCRATIQQMEEENLPASLSQESENGVTPPAERYQELKEAVEAKAAK